MSGVDLGSHAVRCGAFSGNDDIPRVLADVDGLHATPAIAVVEEEGGAITLGEAARAAARRKPHRAVEFGDGKFKYNDECVEGVEFKVVLRAVLARIIEQVSAASKEKVQVICMATEKVQEIDGFRKEIFDSVKRKKMKLVGVHPLVAVLLAYRFDKRERENSKSLVINWGFSKLEVGVVSCIDGVMEIKTYASDASCGGKAFLMELVEFCKKDFFRKAKLDVSESRRALKKLMGVCETTLKVLCIAQQAGIEAESLYEGYDYRSSITRARFEALSSGLLQLGKAFIKSCINSIENPDSEIDHILLAGGMCNFPPIKDFANNLTVNAHVLPNDDLNVRPEEAVVLGATVQAGLLQSMFEGEKLPAAVLESSVELSRVNFSLCAVFGDRIFELIEEGSYLPVWLEKSIPMDEAATTLKFRINNGDKNMDIMDIELDEKVEKDSGDDTILIKILLEATSRLSVKCSQGDEEVQESLWLSSLENEHGREGQTEPNGA